MLPSVVMLKSIVKQFFRLSFMQINIVASYVPNKVELANGENVTFSVLAPYKIFVFVELILK